ncbi:hypothetical protein [Nitrosomonas eutropha]|uniref:Uncharacterized protein n=1 Tax=Nitrosomonas eutropha (strain DSM 101675 / C91 / Nm57) TaxID=335283 RepID=Q0AGL3_NITEC|nr:hypothetical protein [Nitrosomonas eutropha]ABI59519.1 hypothetical protein Neut_1267 [Nitrosomonas eutropha C91]
MRVDQYRTENSSKHAIAASTCRHIVIIAGNHDSPSFLSVPGELLKMLDVHVVGNISGNPANEVPVLRGTEGNTELSLCRSPFAGPGCDSRTVLEHKHLAANRGG